MLEIPEVQTITAQLKETIFGKKVKSILVDQSPHKFAFYFGDPRNYSNLLVGKTIGEIKAISGMVEIYLEEVRIVLGDGVNIRYYDYKKDSAKQNRCATFGHVVHFLSESVHILAERFYLIGINA